MFAKITYDDLVKNGVKNAYLKIDDSVFKIESISKLFRQVEVVMHGGEAFVFKEQHLDFIDASFYRFLK